MKKEVVYSFSEIELKQLVQDALKSKGIKFDRFDINVASDPDDDSLYPQYFASGLTVHYKEPVE